MSRWTRRPEGESGPPRQRAGTGCLNELPEDAELRHPSVLSRTSDISHRLVGHSAYPQKGDVQSDKARRASKTCCTRSRTTTRVDLLDCGPGNDVSRRAELTVRTAATVQGVVPVAARDEVVAVAATQHVVPTLAVDHVVGRITTDVRDRKSCCRQRRERDEHEEDEPCPSSRSRDSRSVL